MKRWRAAVVPYLLILPGGLWLVIFFAIPVIVLISLSTQQGDIVDGFSQTFHFANYANAWDNYHDQFIRSLLYGGIATILCILLGYPVAYWIAFRGGAPSGRREGEITGHAWRHADHVGRRSCGDLSGRQGVCRPGNPCHPARFSHRLRRL